MSLQDVVPQPETTVRGAQGRALNWLAGGSLFLLARGAWLLMTLLLLAMLGLGLSHLYAQLRTVGVGPATDYPVFQLTSADAGVLQAVGVSLDFYAAYRVAVQVLAPLLAFAIPAAIVLRRKPDDRMAILTAFMLLAMASSQSNPSLMALAGSNKTFTLPMNFLNGVSYACWCLFLYVFPDGRWVPRWTRFPVLASSLSVLVWATANGDSGHEFTYLLFAILIGGGLFAQIYRYIRVSGRVQRQQAKWGMTGFILSMSAFALESGPNTLLFWVPRAFAIFFVPLSISFQLLPVAASMIVSVLQWRLWQLDRFINRVLVYGALALFIVGAYLLFLGGLAAAMQPSGPPTLPDIVVLAVLATGLVALLIGPLRERLQRAANQLMYGERDEPYAVLSHLGRRLEAVIDPVAVLPTIVETVAEALKLPYVELALKQGQQLRVAAVYGTRPERGSVPYSREELVAFPLVYMHETIGELRVAPRSPGEALAPNDLALLANLARQAGTAAHAVQLTGELERSLQRMVNAREEARKRLGSDLHDGLGHRLAGLLRKAETAANLLRDMPADAAAAKLLDELQGQARAAINEVRSLAHTLHPPELELLGLVGALRERIRDYHQATGGGRLQATLDAPESLPALPAAVEAAAYYIVQEALTNVVHHAGARHCQVRLRSIAPGTPIDADAAPSAQAALELEVCDDGRGPDLPGDALGAPAGLGLTSMRERAAELGGTCVIAPLADGGTRVFARLPFTPV